MALTHFHLEHQDGGEEQLMVGVLIMCFSSYVPVSECEIKLLILKPVCYYVKQISSSSRVRSRLMFVRNIKQLTCLSADLCRATDLCNHWEAAVTASGADAASLPSPTPTHPSPSLQATRWLFIKMPQIEKPKS